MQAITSYQYIMLTGVFAGSVITNMSVLTILILAYRFTGSPNRSTFG